MARLAMLLLAAATGCRPAGTQAAGEGMPTPMTDHLAADLAVVRQGRIFFAHHSVGQNILAGVERLDSEAGGGVLKVALLAEAAALAGPVLAHAGGGQNGAPKSKIDAFAAAIRGSPGLKPDLAFMKLCYVDFEPRTDVEDLFNHYRRTLDALKRDYPQIRFGHVTTPLIRRPDDLKSSLRRLLGREVWEDAANAGRNEYNRRLAEHFASDPVFDLALVEATAPDGGAVRFELDGRSLMSLYPGYTEDGGHLNATGQRAAGAAALRFAAGALANRGAR
jgi:hypothetical protein